MITDSQVQVSPGIAPKVWVGTSSQKSLKVRGVRFVCQCFKTKAAAHDWHDETKKKGQTGIEEDSERRVSREVSRREIGERS